MANNRLHAFLESMQEMQSLQHAEVEALTRPVGPAGRWPTADAVAYAGTRRGAEPSNGIPVGAAPAWVDPALPPVAMAHDALLALRPLSLCAGLSQGRPSSPSSISSSRISSSIFSCFDIWLRRR